MEALRPTLGSKPRGSKDVESNSTTRLAFVVAVASRSPWVELGSTALLRPGGQSHVEPDSQSLVHRVANLTDKEQSVF